MKVLNVTQGVCIVECGEIAQSFQRRLKGLLFTDSLSIGKGLLIRPCNSVHTFGMKYSIDVVFVDACHIVVKMVTSLKQCRIVTCIGSAYVIELPAGTVARTGTAVGDELEVLY